MSLAALLTQTVTLRKRSGETRDAIGSSSPTFTTQTTRMYLEARESQEEGGAALTATASGRRTPVSEWFGVGLPDVDFDSVDRILWGEHLLEIVGHARPIYNPRLGALSHHEMDLREVDG